MAIRMNRQVCITLIKAVSAFNETAISPISTRPPGTSASSSESESILSTGAISSAMISAPTSMTTADEESLNAMLQSGPSLPGDDDERMQNPQSGVWIGAAAAAELRHCTIVACMGPGIKIYHGRLHAEDNTVAFGSTRTERARSGAAIGKSRSSNACRCVSQHL